MISLIVGFLGAMWSGGVSLTGYRATPDSEQEKRSQSVVERFNESLTNIRESNWVNSVGGYGGWCASWFLQPPITAICAKKKCSFVGCNVNPNVPLNLR